MTIKHQFSPQVESALREAGWHPERQLSVDELKPWCVMWEGDFPLIIFPSAYYFLKEFGGLRISFGDGEVTADILHLDPTLDMTGWFETGWGIGLPLFPLGLIYREDNETNAYHFGIDADGRFWVLAYENYCIGEGVTAAFETISNRFTDVSQPFEPLYAERADEADGLNIVISHQIKTKLNLIQQQSP